MTSRRSPRGQALVFLLPLLLALVAAGYAAYEAGRRVHEKRRLVDAADAAALSAAAWQARALDFEAYTNRAIVANQVVVAQAVSVRAFSDYVNTLLPRAATITQWIPALGTATTTLAESWRSVDGLLQPTLSALETTASLGSYDLAAAQRFMHLATLEAVPTAVRAGLRAADANYELTPAGEAMLARWAIDWNGFASFYGGAWRWRPADVVTRSLDGFTVERNFTVRPLLGLDVLRVVKRGGTELLDFETWRALDTLSVHRRRNLLFGSIRERDVIAWGGAQAGETTAQRGSHGGAYAANPQAARRAEASMIGNVGYRGLPSAYDLSVEQRQRFSPPRIVVRARLAGEPAIHAEAVATTSFARPVERADRLEERPSLYAPFWRAQRVAARSDERLLAATLDATPTWIALVPR